MGERRFTRHAFCVRLRSGCERSVPTESGEPVLLAILVGQIENAPRGALRLRMQGCGDQ
jgi:hypothetical protein